MLVLWRVGGKGRVGKALRLLCDDTGASGRSVAKRVAQIEKVTGGPVSALYNRGDRLPTVTHDRIAHVRTGFAHLQSGEPTPDTAEDVVVMGRVTARRDQSSSLVFLDLADPTGAVQIRAVRKEYTGRWDANGACDEENNVDPFARDVGLARRGDSVAVVGRVMRTKRGELSVVPRALAVLSPCLGPLPEPGTLTDPEERARRREVDLLSNLGGRGDGGGKGSAMRAVFARAAVLRAFRAGLDDGGFVEVETPVMWPSAGGARAAPFVTKSRALGALHLRVAPELFLKRLVIGGIDRVYEIGRCFRNESADASHNPEFTTIEVYRAHADYRDMMDVAESLIRDAVAAAGKAAAAAQVAPTGKEDVADGGNGNNSNNNNSNNNNGADVVDPSRHLQVHVSRFGLATSLPNGVEIDFAQPFRRWDVIEAVEETASCTFPDWSFEPGQSQRLAREFLAPVCISHGIDVDDVDLADHTAGDAGAATLLDRLVSKLVEPRCVQPTFLMHHPVFMSPLAAEHRDPWHAGRCERFELVILGKEIANAYTELADPQEQRRRLGGGGGGGNSDDASRPRGVNNDTDSREGESSGDHECAEADGEFADALEYGLPPTGGLGIGIDRLVMIICDAPSIRDVIAFPAMRRDG